MHPLALRIMHWTNAIAMIVMIGSGWKIYNDEVIFGFLHFPQPIVLGVWAQHALAVALLRHVGAGAESASPISPTVSPPARFARLLFPIRPREVIAEAVAALTFRLKHQDLTHYNAVQKLLYVGVITIIVVQVASGLAIWKPVQFSGLVSMLGGFQSARLIHFLGMAAIVLFMVVHVALGAAGAEDAARHVHRRPPPCPTPTLSCTPMARPRPIPRADLRPRKCPSAPSSGQTGPPLRAPTRASWSRNRALLERIDRRKLLRGSLSLGALSLLAGCDISNREEVQGVLYGPSPTSTTACRPHCSTRSGLAPTYSRDLVVKPPRFNAYYEIDEVKPVDLSTWKLELSGLVKEQAAVDAGIASMPCRSRR